MEFKYPELRRDKGGGASFYASSSSSSSGARYPSDAGLNRHGIGPAGPSLRDPLPAPSYREDRELEIRRCRLREIADKIELAHFSMLEAHDKRALAIAERAPYARHIPFYPELPPDNSQVNHTAQAIRHSRSPQWVAPMYHEVLDKRQKIQKDRNLGPHRGSQVGVEVPSILRTEEVVPHVGLSSFPELRDGARSHCQPIEPVEVVCPVGPAPDVWLDERPADDPILQNRFPGYNMMLPPQFMHEPPAPLPVPVPVPVPIIEKKVGSSAHTNKKRKGNGPSKSEKVENNRSEGARTGLTLVIDGDQEEISEIWGPQTNKKTQLVLPPANLKQKSYKLHKGEVVLTQENKETTGSDTNKTIQPELPPFNLKRKFDEANKEEASPTLENKEIAGSSTTKKIKLDLPLLNLRRIPNEVVQTPENEEVAGSSTNRKRKLDLHPSNLKQKLDEPSNEEVIPIPENEEKPATGTTEPGWVGPEGGSFWDSCKINTLTKRTLNDHFQSDAHHEKLNALLNGCQKSEPANKILAEKSVQGVSQAVSLPKLEEPKEETSKSVPNSQSDKIKEMTSQDKGNSSSSNRTVISTGHRKIQQPTPKFSKKKKKAPGNSSAPVLVKQGGKWFCTLCEAKCSTEKNKEDHVKGKRHRKNLQAQAVSRKPAPAKPPARLHWCFICNICCTSERGLIEHLNGKKHRETLTKQINVV